MKRGESLMLWAATVLAGIKRRSSDYDPRRNWNRCMEAAVPRPRFKAWGTRKA